MGHLGQVAVLNGGLPEWKSQLGSEYMIDDTPVDRIAVEEPGSACSGYRDGDDVRYKASMQHELVKSLKDVVATYEYATGDMVIDARPAPRFKGEAPEPRAGLQSGHVPGSANVPWGDVLDSVEVDGVSYTRFKTEDGIRSVFESVGLNAGRTNFSKVIASCGSGTTACILVMASEQIKGKRGVMSVYDGSWSEYGGSGARIDTC
jgi:thiosulfate/3-mercaptopyruvate sulfurtransferase